MSNPNLIEFIKAPWSVEAEMLLREATGDNPSYTINDLRAEVEAGRTHLKAVIDHNSGKPVHLGYMCMWIDPFGDTNELVLQAGAAFANTIQKVGYVAPALVRLMHENQCNTMRAHTYSKAMVLALKRAGFQVSKETILRFGG